MDAQELRNLQEAYMEVVENQQLDEALTGERYKKVMKKPGGTAYSRKVSADPSKRGKRGGKGGVESDFGSPDRGSGNKAARRAGTYQEEEVSVYDIILSHLLDEGYAETPEAAEAIMVNMSEEWRQDIMEVLDTPERANAYARKNVRSMLGAFAKGVANKDISQLKTINKRTEGAKRAKRKAERKAAEEES